MTAPDTQVKKLTAREQLFVERYCVSFNAAQAAREAGYSERNARFIGSQNLTKLHIANAIKAHLAANAMSSDEVLARVADHARSSMEPFLRRTESGECTGFDLGDSKPVHLLKSVKHTTVTRKDGSIEHSVEVRLHDAQAALFKMGEHHQLWGKSRVMQSVDLNSLTTEQLKRIAAGEDPVAVLANS